MNFFRKMLRPNTGISSKRFIGLAASFSIILISFINLITGLSVTEYIFQGLVYLALGGLFGIASEKFAEAMKGNRGGITDRPADVDEPA